MCCTTVLPVTKVLSGGRACSRCFSSSDFPVPACPVKKTLRPSSLQGQTDSVLQACFLAERRAHKIVAVQLGREACLQVVHMSTCKQKHRQSAVHSMCRRTCSSTRLHMIRSYAVCCSADRGGSSCCATGGSPAEACRTSPGRLVQGSRLTKHRSAGAHVDQVLCVHCEKVLLLPPKI